MRPDTHSNNRETSMTAAPDRWHRRSHRRAVALLLALVIISIGGLAAMRFLQSTTHHWLMSQTLVEARRADLLAESGMSEACYWLRHPTLTGGAIWTGVTNRPLDGGPDTYTVTLAPRGGDAKCYTVSSEGRLAGAGVGMVRTVRADFRMHYGFVYAVAANYDLVVPENVRITGDVYSWNTLLNRGHIDGDACVSFMLANLGTITGASNYDWPVPDLGSYPIPLSVTYESNSWTYSAELILLDLFTNVLLQSHAGNPMGIRHRNGNLRLAGNNTIDGTLLVTGNLTLAAGTTRITSRPGFPALVVNGNLVLEGDAFDATFNGAVIVHGTVQSTGSMPTSRLAINGPLVLMGPGGGFDPAFSTEPQVTIRFDAGRADVSGLFPLQPQGFAGGELVRYRADGS